MQEKKCLTLWGSLLNQLLGKEQSTPHSIHFKKEVSLGSESPQERFLFFLFLRFTYFYWEADLQREGGTGRKIRPLGYSPSDWTARAETIQSKGTGAFSGSPYRWGSQGEENSTHMGSWCLWRFCHCARPHLPIYSSLI